MRDSMQALILDKDGNLKKETLPLPECTAGEVLLQVTHCGLCKTDAQIVHNGHRDLTLPRIPGHEIVGRDPETGKVYAVWPGHACGNCIACQGKQENLCPSMAITGFHRHGGMAEYAAIPAGSLIPLPEGLPPSLATLAEPLACCLNGLDKIKLPEKVGKPPALLIHGGGPVGLLMGLAAQVAGWQPHILEKKPQRREKARLFCGELAIKMNNELPDGLFHAGANATSGMDAFAEGLQAIMPGGEYVFFSGLRGSNEIPAKILNEIHYREISLHGAYGCTARQMERALAILLEYAEVAGELIAAEITLADAPAALEEMLAGKGMRKIVVFPG